MCEALEKLTEQEALELKKDVKSLTAWRNKISGAMVLLLAISGVLTFFLYRAIGKMDTLGDNITGLTTELAVFSKGMEPFITAGPRFTPQMFEDKMEVWEARMEKKVLETVKKETPPPEVKQALTKGEQDHRQHATQIESLESRLMSQERRIETLEKSAHVKP